MRSGRHRRRVYEAVLAQLAQLIQQGQLRPGDRLPAERELAAQLRVSRASLREALRSLELQGLVRSRQGAGTFIAAMPQDDLLRAFAHLSEERQTLRDIFELRFLLEPPLAALAARRATPEDLARLEAALAAQARHLRAGESGVAADEAFHAALAEATHNRALRRLGAALMDVLAPCRNPHLQTPARVQLSLESHTRILDAVRAGDAKAAYQAMADHITRVDRLLFGLAEDALAGLLPAEERGAVYDQAH